MKLLTLQNDVDNFALVDDEDYERLSMYRWLINCDGYAIRYEGSFPNRVTVRLHNDVLKIPAGSGIDHKDRHKLNNQKENLRLATEAQNNQNSFKAKINKSGYIGVSWDKQRRKWLAQIRFGGVKTNLGRFDTALEAAKQYDEAALMSFGPDALTNKRLQEE